MKSLRVIMLLAVAAAGLALALFSTRTREEPRFRIVEIGDAELGGDQEPDGDPDRGATMSVQSRSIATDQVDYLAQLGPALGQTYWVRPGGDEEAGDGSRDNPWSDLRARVAALESGDRLVLLPGRYTGPFVLPEFNGEHPVEIVGARSPVLRNQDEANAPVVRIEGRWHLVGLEIQPGPTSIGIEIASGDEAQIRALHINSGGREGVVIRAPARNVAMLETHVHHVGGAERAGILIEDGARDLQLIRNKIHRTGAEPILLFQPGRFTQIARGREGSRRVQLPELNITIIEDPWEP